MTMQYEQKNINFQFICSQPQYRSEYFEEFLMYDDVARGWVATANAGTVVVGGSASEDDQHPGIIDMTVAGVVPNTSYAGYRQSTTQQTLGGGEIILEFCFELESIPDAVDDFLVQNGFRDTNSGNPTDGLVVACESASPNWQLEAYDPALNSIDTGIEVVAGWQIHRIHVNADASEAYLIVADSNGQHLSPVLSGGLPTLTDTLGLGFAITFIAGAPAIRQSLDYVYFNQFFPAGRRLGV